MGPPAPSVPVEGGKLPALPHPDGVEWQVLISPYGEGIGRWGMEHVTGIISSYPYFRMNSLLWYHDSDVSNREDM